MLPEQPKENEKHKSDAGEEQESRDMSDDPERIADGGTPRPFIEQNAGKCDICGESIVMTDGDELVVLEHGITDDKIREEHGLTDKDVMDSVADAMESVAETPAGRDFAHVIRGKKTIRTHADCLEQTNYSLLEVETDTTSEISE